MKDATFDAMLVAAGSRDHGQNTAFTDKVMASIESPEIFSSQLRNMSVNKKETLFMKLKHLPKLAIIAIALGAVTLLTGTAYAVLKTAERLTNVTVNESTTNEFGRKQLAVTFDNCKLPGAPGTTFELKRESGLSPEDGEKLIQASCEMSNISNWIEKELHPSAGPMYLYDQARTVTAITDTTITLGEKGEQQFPANARVVVDNAVAQRADLKVGDTVLHYPFIAQYSFDREKASKDTVIFKLSQERKYYGIELHGYVNARGACLGNPERMCLISNGIEQTHLTVATGNGQPYVGQTEAIKVVQGKVISYTATEISIDTGKGVTYTIATPSNIIEQFNKTAVYKLKSTDTIYAKANPEQLKIKQGDSLEIYYQETEAGKSHTLTWAQVTTVNLMTERTPNNLDVIRKY